MAHHHGLYQGRPERDGMVSLEASLMNSISHLVCNLRSFAGVGCLGKEEERCCQDEQQRNGESLKVGHAQ